MCSICLVNYLDTSGHGGVDCLGADGTHGEVWDGFVHEDKNESATVWIFLHLPKQ